MQYDTKTIYLNNTYPEFGNNTTGIFFTVAGKTEIIFDLSNVDKGLDNGLGIYKTYINFGDGNAKYYESSFNLNAGIFLPPESIKHTYVVSTTGDKFDGAIDFFYMNGYTTRIELSAFVSQTNLIDIGLQNTENQLFLSEQMKKIVTFSTEDNDMYNCVIVPTLLNEYSREARSVIPKLIDRNVFLQTSKRGDQQTALSAVDVLATNITPGQGSFSFLVF